MSDFQFEPKVVETVQRMCDKPEWQKRMGRAVECQPESLPYPPGTEPVRKPKDGD